MNAFPQQPVSIKILALKKIWWPKQVLCFVNRMVSHWIDYIYMFKISFGINRFNPFFPSQKREILFFCCSIQHPFACRYVYILYVFWLYRFLYHHVFSFEINSATQFQELENVNEALMMMSFLLKKNKKYPNKPKRKSNGKTKSHKSLHSFMLFIR